MFRSWTLIPKDAEPPFGSRRANNRRIPRTSRSRDGRRRLGFRFAGLRWPERPVQPLGESSLPAGHCAWTVSETQMKHGVHRAAQRELVRSLLSRQDLGGHREWRNSVLPRDYRRCQGRHRGLSEAARAIALGRQVEQWLDPATPTCACLIIPPEGYVHVAFTASPARQRSFVTRVLVQRDGTWCTRNDSSISRAWTSL